MPRYQNDNPFYMAGTEGTGEYQVLSVSDYGRVGTRILSDGRVRVRIEPGSAHASKRLAEMFTRDDGWKQPGDAWQDRFSKVFSGLGTAMSDVGTASEYIRSGPGVLLSPEEMEWQEHKQHLQLQQKKVRTMTIAALVVAAVVITVVGVRRFVR